MNNSIPKISVLVITYRQEQLISRALDSLIAQKDYIYEICVSDDCSPDNTWTVIQEYQDKYPYLFKLNRNEVNLGIFENIEKVWSMPTGDAVFFLSGDDEAGQDWFRHVIDFIQQKKIDYKNELFCIYGDTKTLYPNGDSFIKCNRMVEKKPNDVLSMVIREVVGSSGTCFSINVLKKYQKVSRGRSYAVEEVQDRLRQLNTDKAYYIPAINAVYHAGIGVSKSMSRTEKEGRRDIFKFAYDYLSKTGKLKKKDGYYYLYKDAKLQYQYEKNLKRLVEVVYYRCKSLIIRYDYNYSKIKRIVFAIKRRLPHSKPIMMNI